MSVAERRVLVKRGTGRSVWRERAPEATRSLAVKRFEFDGSLTRARALRRARRERAVLLRLAELGFRVPAPLACVERDGAIELTLTWIESACTLSEIVRGERPWPSDRRVLARRLGVVLAQARRQGVTHSDLHAGNILVDVAGDIWLVDVAGVRLHRRELTEREHARNVVTMAAELRELTPLWWRLAVVCACERDLVQGSLNRKTLAAWGAAARRRRREVVEHSTRRWWRESSVAAPIRRGAERGFRARTLVESEAWSRLDDLSSLIIAGDPAVVFAAWRTAARASAHGLPCARPLALRTHPTARAVFEGHAGDQDLFAHGGDGASRRRSARDLGRVLGMLEDRGLKLASEIATSFARTTEGRLYLLPTAVLGSSAGANTAQPTDVVALAARASPRERAAFVSGFLKSLELGPEQRRAWVRVWQHTPSARREAPRRRVRAALLEVATRAAGIVPQGVLRAGLSALAPAARFTRHERLTRANLELALGTTHSAREQNAIASGVRRHSARLFAEWLKLAHVSRDDADCVATRRWLAERVDIDASVAVLERELAQGRGAIVVSAHIGNWEFLAARLASAGHRGAVVGYRRPHDSTAQWFERLRAGYGVENIPQASNPRTILRALSAGRVVGLLADLEVRRLDGEFVPFFGRDALTMTAPAALARATHKPLLPARCTFDARSGRYHISFDDPLGLDPALPREERIVDLCARLNRCFERWIRAEPEQWAWHQPRWRTRRGDIEIMPLPSRRQAARSRKPDPPALRMPRSLHSVDKGLSRD